jgi:hypothetical protein
MGGRTKQAEDEGEGMIMDMAEDTSTRGLIWTARRSCPRDDKESVEGDPEPSDPNDNACDSHVNPPKVERQSTTEQQERKLQHQWQGLHHVFKVPGDDPIQLPLPILAAFYPTPSHVRQRVSIQPLLPEHRQKSGEE